MRTKVFAAVLLLPLWLVACGNEPVTSEGKQLYEANCASCHGLAGEGQPNWQQPDESGRFPAPPHDQSGHTWHHADAALLQIIAEGGQMPNSAMPGYREQLTEAQMVAILDHIKSFWPQREREFQEEVSRRQPASP